VWINYPYRVVYIRPGRSRGMLTKTGGAEIHAFFALAERQRATASNLSRVAGSFRFTDWPCHRGPVIPNSLRFIGLCASKAPKPQSRFSTRPIAENQSPREPRPGKKLACCGPRSSPPSVHARWPVEIETRALADRVSRSSSRSRLFCKPSLDQGLIWNIPLISSNLDAFEKRHWQA
jgi:hypothetical protein